MSMEDVWLRQSVHGWVLFLGIKSVYSDKSERHYRRKCLGWPVTSYGGGHLTPHVKIWTQLIDLVPNVWLHSSVGKASHRYCGGHGLEYRWSPDFSQASSFQLLKLENELRWSLFTFIIYSWSKYVWDFEVRRKEIRNVNPTEVWISTKQKRKY